MAQRKKNTFNDPQFNAYCHFVLLNLTNEEKRAFTVQELRKIKPGKPLLAFCSDASVDEKLIMLAKAGVPSTIVCRQKDFKRSELMEFYDQYADTGVNPQLQDKLLENKVFVLGSAKMMLAYYYIHQNCQSDFYRYNRNYQKIFQLWGMMGQDLGAWRANEDLKEISRGVDLLIEMVFKIMRNPAAFADLGLGKATDLHILFYLMRKNRRNDNRTIFVREAVLFEECTDGSWKEANFHVRLSWLYQHKFIEKRDEKYAIADKGVMVVMEYLTKMAEYIKFEL